MLLFQNTLNTRVTAHVILLSSIMMAGSTFFMTSCEWLGYSLPKKMHWNETASIFQAKFDHAEPLYLHEIVPVGGVSHPLLWDSFAQTQRLGVMTSRAVVFHGMGGLADTVNGLMSAAMYAMLQGHQMAFVSDLNPAFRPDELGWHLGLQVTDNFTRIRLHLAEQECLDSGSLLARRLWTTPASVALADVWISSPSSLVEVKTNCPLHMHWANNRNLYDKLLKVGLVNASSHHPTGFQVGHRLSRLLLQPSNELLRKIGPAFLQASLEGYKIVGLQVGSTNGVLSTTERGIWQKHFFACAQKVGAGLSPNKAKYYVSGDASAHNSARAFFGADRVLTSSDILGPTTQHIFYTVLDGVVFTMYISELVLTPGTNLSSLMTMMWGQAPHYVILDEGPEKYSCKKMDLHDPIHGFQYMLTTSAPRGVANHMRFENKTGTAMPGFVGKLSPLWNVSNERLEERWRLSQLNGQRYARVSKWQGEGGLANMLNAFFSGAVHALLSDRRFVFESSFNFLFQDALWDWNETNNGSFPCQVKSSPVRLTNQLCFPADSPIANQFRSRNYVDQPGWEDCVVVYTNCPLFKWWGQNSVLKQKMIDFGLYDPTSDLDAGFQAAHQLARMLLQPSDSVRAQVLKVFEHSMVQGYAIVGVQIRVAGDEIGDSGYLFGPATMGWPKHFFSCAKKIGEGIASQSHRQVKYYVSTDNMRVHEDANQFFGQENVLRGLGTVLHTGKQADVTKDGHVRAAMDSLYMGQYADALVITPGSTFGLLAAISSGRKPYHVLLDEGPNQFSCVQFDTKRDPARYDVKKNPGKFS